MDTVLYKRICPYLVLALLLALFLTGCGRNAGPAQTAAPDLAGFILEGERVYGGGPSLDAPNLKGLSAQADGQDTLITLSFSSGSRLSGSATESEAASLPSYNILLLPSPARLVIEFEALSYWDYLRSLDLSQAPAVQGAFQHMLSSGSAVSLYIHLAGDMAFQVREEGGSLSIRLRPRGESDALEDDGIMDITDAGILYYVVADAYRDYCSDALTREIDMLPCLSQGGSHIVLISRGFATAREAETFRTATLLGAEGAKDSEWEVMELPKNTLPDFSEESLRAAAHEATPVRLDGIEAKLIPLIADGHYLCAVPGGGVLYSKRVTESKLLEDYIYEQLYILDGGGNSRRLLPFEFETVEKASYSPDGRKLAVLERAAESSHLYIFETDSRELLTDLCELGFGDMVSTFTWDSLGMTIYAISGASGMDIHQYAFNVPDEAKRHSVVDRDGVDEGSLGYAGGELYFAETDLSSGAMIYRIKPEGGVRKAFLPGASFAISPDESHMAVNAAGGDVEAGAGGSVDSFFLYDMATGTSRPITSDFSVYDYFWSLDGERIYYFENRLSGSGGESGAEAEAALDVKNDPYPYVLFMYSLASGQSTRILELPTTALHPGDRDGCLYLCYSDSETLGQRVRATYIIDIDEILAER